MLRSVIGARLSFFHTVLVGRVLNRFTKDAQAADELLPYCWLDTFVCFAINAQSVGLLAVALPLSLLLRFSCCWCSCGCVALSFRVLAR